ncbi:hypothetical protein BU23DRAFT_560647 [Bimuria novae-zelandiae CBS 107.79]|uniref:AA1-like domain-containing protein n=1 Tax=Bimuria novae-zelandiae CBS 107.79 TaxID=1447943 RepID=A0A6A5UQ92_9PLEO|nr:hypothetical protein BU23DRAFT_560647 [Bimuria novae-zelandiae CBS 107.79]
MRAFTALLSAAALATTVTADFYIYRGIQYITVNASTLDSYLFLSAPPSCDDVYNARIFSVSNDVSGGKEGVRCKGCSTAEDPDVQVTELEFNIDEYGHYTSYIENNELVDLDNNVVGHCNIDAADTYNCFDALATYKGQSQLFCTTDLAIP